MMHLDLFSGIGGFAYATDQVWDNVEHIFCDNDKFCRAVLKKHWPESEIYNDIKKINTNPFDKGLEREQQKQAPRQFRQSDRTRQNQEQRPFILTGGFPCQPFSAAGLRRGTADERHLWPEMLRVIRLTKPTWVIAENVRGILTWNNGMVFEQVCADLEASGYEVQPFIIPAVAVNAPHRRDRVWFIAHTTDKQQRGMGLQREPQQENTQPSKPSETIANAGRKHGQSRSINGHEPNTSVRPSQTEKTKRYSINVTDSQHKRLEGRDNETPQHWQNKRLQLGPKDWSRNWSEIAAELCSVDDGLSIELGELKLSKAQHRKEQLKAYGNAIVPQVAIEIMKGIKAC